MATLIQHKQILNSWFLNLLNHKIAINLLTEMQILLKFQQKSTWPLWSTDQCGMRYVGDIHASCSLVVTMVRVYQFDSIALLLAIFAPLKKQA